MKLERNKLLFIGLLVCLLGFIVLYALSMDKESGDGELKQPKVPTLTEEPEEYRSKLEAVDAIKEERERPKPSLYGEQYIDSTGGYDTTLEDKERQRIVDSIYREGRIDYGARVYRKPKGKPQKGDEIKPEKHSSHIIPEQERIDFSTAHSAFFATKAVKRDSVHPPVAIQAMVNGE